MFSRRLVGRVVLLVLLPFVQVISAPGHPLRGDSVAQYLAIRKTMGHGLFAASSIQLRLLVDQYPDYIDPYLALCEASQYSNSLRDAEEFLVARIEKGRGIHQALCAQGVLLLNQRRFTEALEYLQEAQALGFRDVILSRSLVYCLEGMIGAGRVVQYFQGLSHRFPERDDYWYSLAISLWLSMDYSNLLLAIDRAIDLKPQETRYAQLKIAAVLTNHPSLKMIANAEDMAFKSLESGNLEGSEFLRWTIGNAYRRLGHDVRATTTLKQSLESSLKSGQQKWAANALLLMASYHLADGAADVASNEAQAAHSMFELANDSDGIVNATRVQLGAAMELGRYHEVISIALKALKGLELSKRHMDAADVTLDAALAFHELGADDIALEYAIEAQKKFGGTSFPLFKRMSIEMAFGVINEGLGNLDVALDHHSLALDMVRRLGDPDRLRMVCYGNLGNTLLALGDISRAKTYFMHQLSLARFRHNIKEQSSALCGLGKVSRVRGKAKVSRSLLTSGYTLSAKAGHRMGFLRAIEALAELEEWQGNFDTASYWYGRLIEEIAAGKNVSLFRLHSNLTNREVRSLVNRYVHCLCKSGDVSKAFEMLEKWRLELSIANPYLVRLGPGCTDSALIAKKVEDFKALTRKACELALLRKKNPSWLMNSEIDLNTVLTITELELRRTEIIEAIEKMESPSEPFDDSAQTNRGLIQTKLLGEEDAVLEYVVGDTDVDMFCLTRHNLKHAVYPIKRSNLENIVAQLSPVGRRSITERYLDLASFSSFDDTLAHRMFLALVKPFEAELLGKRRLTIVRDGPITNVPFELLCVGLGFPDSSRYLVGLYEIGYASSATSICLTQEPGRFPKVAFLGLGNPEPESLADNVGSHRRRMSTKANSMNVRSLPEAELEVEELSDLFGEGDICLVREQATESAFKEMAGNCSVIHIGAHARLDTDIPMLSCLQLRGDSVKGEDGELMAYEIAELDLCARLVVLSSCASLARHEESASDGLLRGFQDAGVPSLIGTTWEVEDRDARVFMGFLYAGLLAGENIAAALQKAKLSFIKTGRADPYRWAPYILVGKPGVKIGEFGSKIDHHSKNLIVDLAWYAVYAVLFVGILRMAISKAKARAGTHE